MADNEKQKNTPKDITPNPMSEAEKKNSPPAEGAPEGAAADAAQVEEEPQDLKGALKTSFVDSPTMNRALQLILIAAGLFGMFLGFRGQELMPLPAALGAFALALAAWFDIYIGKKFSKESGLGTISKVVLAGVLSALMVTFIVEIFKKFDLPTNKLIVMLAMAVIAVVYIIQAILYIRQNKEKIVADIQMLIATVVSALAIFLFFSYYAVPAFLLVGTALVLIIMSVTKDPLKDDGRLNPRLWIIGANIAVFLMIFAYAATIFFVKPIEVTNYGKITPAYASKPLNLSWSGDSWSFAYNLKDAKKKDATVNIMNSLSMGINTLPPKKNQEMPDSDISFKFPISRDKKKEVEKNLAEKKEAKAESAAEAEAAEDIKLPEYLDAPIFNDKGNFLIFSGGETKDGPRNIWGVSLTLTLFEMEKSSHEKEAEEELSQEERVIKNAKERARLDKLNMPVGKPKVVVADINKIIDMDCRPLTHKTAWAPGGKEFVFNAAGKDGVYNVWSSNTQDQTIDKITKGEQKLMPLWSPKGDKVLYVSKTDSYTYLKVADIDGKNARELNPKNARDKALFPLWNAAESKVIYLKKGKLIIMNASATDQQGLGPDTLTPSPYWLTDKKKKITLEYTDSGTIWKIFTINPNGKKNKKIFEEVCETLTQPKWSYDGEAIITGANYKKDSSLWRLDRDGKFKTRLYTTKHKVAEMEWSPTSQRIAFIVKKKAIQSVWYDAKTNLEELWVINNDGTQPMCQYEATGEINHMSWDDQGKRLAFDEKYDRWYFQPKLTVVKIVHAIGGEKWDLLPYEFYGESPTWSNDGDVIAYIAWRDFWMKSFFDSSRLWVAQLQ